MFFKLLILLLISYNVHAEYVESSVIVNQPNIIKEANIFSDIEIIADKVKGVMYLKRPDQEIVVIPALFGKEKSDDISKWEINKITPAGIYSLEKAYSVKMKSNILMFKKSDKNILAIHPVYIGKPEQRREERLTNGDPSDNRITSGCINVMPEFFDILFALPNKTRLTILPEEQTLEDN